MAIGDHIVVAAKVNKPENPPDINEPPITYFNSCASEPPIKSITKPATKKATASKIKLIIPFPFLFTKSTPTIEYSQDNPAEIRDPVKR